MFNRNEVGCRGSLVEDKAARRASPRAIRILRAPVRIAVLLAAWIPVAAAADAAPAQAQAQLLDHAEFLCANCFFGPSDYHYCFAAGNTILTGHRKTPVMNWRDETKNYLTPLHAPWAAWSAPGLTVPIRYDDRHIWLPKAGKSQPRQGHWKSAKALAAWISRADSKKDVRLTRDSKRDIFTNDQCRGAARSAQ